MNREYKPKFLIVSTASWFPIARLAMALAEAGCRVDAVCPPRDPLSKTGVVQRIHFYSGLLPLRSLERAIQKAQPDCLVPGDDLAVRHLHRLHQQAKTMGAAGKDICALIERSFGAPESFPIIAARSAFIELAQKEGVRVPETGVLNDFDDLRKWASKHGFPAMLKANGTTGGAGVKIVRNLTEAEEAFRTLQAPPLLARAAKRALVNQDNSLIWSSLLRRQSVVNIQGYIAGREATSAVACWEGRVLASLHFEVLQKAHAFGPATVMRRIEHPEMTVAAEKLVRRLKLSGLHGFDYMIENGSENAYLIEINPRATQVGHLALGQGRDLPSALHAAVAGQALGASKKLTENDTIALYPQEWVRDPESPYLKSAYHDVPWAAPELMRASLRLRNKRSNRFFRPMADAGTISRPSPVVKLAKSNRDLDF